MNKMFKAIITIIRISIGCIALIFLFSYLVSALDPEVKELYWGAKEDFSITILYFVFLGLLLLIGFYKEFLFILKELGFKDFVTKTISIAKSVSNNMLSFLKKNKKYLIIGLGVIIILFLFLYPMWEEKIAYWRYNRCIDKVKQFNRTSWFIKTTYAVLMPSTPEQKAISEKCDPIINKIIQRKYRLNPRSSD